MLEAGVLGVKSELASLPPLLEAELGSCLGSYSLETE